MPETKAYTILLVDDEPSILKSLQRLLRSKFEVLTAQSGEDALALLRSQPVQVVITDQRMPGMTGVEFLAAAKAVRPEAARLMLTGYADLQDLTAAVNVGEVQFYLAKPWDPDELVATIEKAGANVQQTLAAQRQTEAALGESEAHYRALVEGTPGIVYAFSNRVGGVYTSPQVWAILGYSPEQLAAQPMLWHDSIHPDDIGQVNQSIDAAAAGQTFCIEYRIRDARGQWHWFEDRSIRSQVDHAEVMIEGLAVDITARKEAEEALRISEAWHRTILQTAMDGFWMADTHGQLLDVNEAYCQMSGYTKPELLTMCIANLEANEMASDVPIHIQELIAQGQDRFESRHRRKDGSLFDVAVSVQYRDRDGGRFVTFIQDITERKQAEEALRQLNNVLEQRVAERTLELRQVNTQLEQAMRTKDEFIANMSHELRTPLTSILGLSESLQMQTYGPLSEKQIQSLQAIHASGEHLLALITDVLDLAKIGAGKLELQLGPVEVADYSEACLRLVSPLADKKQISVTAHFDPAVECLQADGRRFKQMLVNLLSNAVKFTPKYGRVGLEVTGDATRGLAHLVVWDTGLGISAENQLRLFQPFTQVESSLSRQHDGAGLGLVLVRQLAEMHGGSVGVESQGVPGEGSRFTLSLPWCPAARSHPGAGAARPDAAPEAAPATASEGQGPLIIVAEDNATVAKILADTLQAQGYHVLIAIDGPAALDLVHQQLPAAILMDVQMPMLNGLEVIGRLRAEAAFATVPIIALTALAMPGDRERCLAAGANAYLSKPIKFHQLLDMLQRLLVPPGAASQRPAEKTA